MNKIFKKVGFTLAEVLITLAVIGVVAAVTMPVLIKQHQKQVVVTRMQKFYANFNQAILLSKKDNDDMKYWTFTDWYHADKSYEFWEKYLKPYMKYVKEVKNTETLWPTYGVDVYLADGSAFQLSGTWITYYPVAKKRNTYNSHEVFVFTMNSSKNRIEPKGMDRANSEILKSTNAEHCVKKAPSYNSNRLCATLIFRAGWRIDKNYPW